jgi:hypothetical protein
VKIDHGHVAVAVHAHDNDDDNDDDNDKGTNDNDHVNVRGPARGRAMHRPRRDAIDVMRERGSGRVRAGQRDQPQRCARQEFGIHASSEAPERCWRDRPTRLTA